MNFRTQSYGIQHPEVLGLDLPPGYGQASFGALSNAAPDGAKKGWYVFSNVSGGATQRGRDAAGVVTASRGRFILNFGGLVYTYPRKRRRGLRDRRAHPMSEVRVLDTCDPGKGWVRAGTLGFALFALQTCASHRLNVAVTCGGTGEALWRLPKTEYNQLRGNFPRCIVNRLPGMSLDLRGFR